MEDSLWQKGSSQFDLIYIKIKWSILTGNQNFNSAVHQKKSRIIPWEYILLLHIVNCLIFMNVESLTFANIHEFADSWIQESWWYLGQIDDKIKSYHRYRKLS